MRASIAVVGAGPAGSVAAIILASRGHRVTLYEKATFPRDKVCGECVSSTGIGVLGRIGLEHEMCRQLSPVLLRRAQAVAIDGTAAEVRLPDTMWGLTRRAMDQWLLHRAEMAGVDVRIGVGVDALQTTSAGAVLTMREQATRSAAGEYRFDYVVAADGGRLLGRGEPTGDFGIKAHFTGVLAAADQIELIALGDGAYAGIAPVANGSGGSLWNTAWSVPGAWLKRCRGNIDALFGEACTRSRTLRERFKQAHRVDAWMSCPLPRYAVRPDWPDRVIPIGNAAAALEPVGGEGMGLAMRSAELAAAAIDRAVRSGQPLESAELRHQFEKLWRIRRAACRTGAWALSHAWLGPLCVGLAGQSPPLARLGMTLVGK